MSIELTGFLLSVVFIVVLVAGRSILKWIRGK